MSQSGYIALVGRPNVGKSTLLNALLGQKIAAVSPKPQTTRHKILGIKTVSSSQMLFLDTPGVHFAQTGKAGSSLKSGGESLSPPDHPHHKKILNQYMMEVAKAALDEADVFVLIIEPTPHLLDVDREVFSLIRDKGKPVLVAINKIDRVDKKKLLPLIDECTKELAPKAVIPLSALDGRGIDRLESEILENLPEGTFLYPEDQVTDRTERFLASEIVREKLMDLLHEEVPYAVTVLIEDFREPPSPGLRPPSPAGGEGKTPVTHISAVIIVEKDSQKGILIGHKGGMIKKIGELARKELEGLLGTRVYLGLFVRVEKDWTKDERKVKEFAYE